MKRLVKPSDCISVAEGLIKDKSVEEAIKKHFLLEVRCGAFGLALESEVYGHSIKELEITEISYAGVDRYGFKFEIKSTNFKFSRAYTYETIDRMIHDNKNLRVEVMNRSLECIEEVEDLLILQIGQYDELKEKVKKMVEKEEDN